MRERANPLKGIELTSLPAKSIGYSAFGIAEQAVTYSARCGSGDKAECDNDETADHAHSVGRWKHFNYC